MVLQNPPCAANRMRSLCCLTHCPLLLPYVSLDKTLPKFRREDHLAAHTRNVLWGTANGVQPQSVPRYKTNPWPSTVMIAFASSISATYHFTKYKRFIRAMTYWGLFYLYLWPVYTASCYININIWNWKQTYDCLHFHCIVLKKTVIRDISLKLASNQRKHINMWTQWQYRVFNCTYFLLRFPFKINRLWCSSHVLN
jgi:hypothetical protein